MSELEKEIRAQIARYVDNEQNVDEFFRWFFVETWELPADSPRSLRELVARIGMVHGEWTSGHLSADDATDLLLR